MIAYKSLSILEANVNANSDQEVNESEVNVG